MRCVSYFISYNCILHFVDFVASRLAIAIPLVSSIVIIDSYFSYYALLQYFK
jgi:hypothetical protein